MKRLLYLVILSIVVLFLARTNGHTQESDRQILVDVPKPLPITTEYSRPILGLRETSSTFLASKLVDAPQDPKSKSFYIPEAVVINAWLSDKKFADLIRTRGITEIDLEAIRASGIDVSTFDWSPVGVDYKSIRPQRIEGENTEDFYNIDSTAIIAMTSNNMLDLSSRYPMLFGKPKQYALALQPEYAKTLVDAYTDAKQYSNYPFSDPTVDWKAPDALLKTASQKFPIQTEKFTVQVGVASFGKVRLQSAQEAGFKVDRRLAQKYDIYLVELVTTLHNLPSSGVEEISLRVDCTEACVAWELAPLRVSAESEVTTTTKSPEITFKDLSVGEFFSQTVKFTSLRPEIIAYGLREDQFSWSLSAGAVGMGSYKFLAAIGLPKGSKDLHLSRAVGIRTSDGFFLEGKWAVTENLLETIPLKP